MSHSDFLHPSDVFKPLSKLEQLAKDKLKAEKLTRKLEYAGVDKQKTSDLVESLERKAHGAIDHSDWMTLDTDRFQPATYERLQAVQLTPSEVLSHPDKAEIFVAEVLKREGIPTGNGDTEPLNDVISGFYDTKGHGMDLIGVDQGGIPFPIEVKKYHQTSLAALSDYRISDLEPTTQRWKDQRKRWAELHNNESLYEARADAEEIWKPEVSEWRKQVAQDADAMKTNHGDLPITQMDDLWTQDRWLKILNSPERQDQLQRAGVPQRFCDLKRLQSSPWLPEWQELLRRRTVVVVSDGQGSVGKKLYGQLRYAHRCSAVVKIQI